MLSPQGGGRPRSRRGGPLLFLPAYSPGFNRIELAFTKVKRALRRAAARTPDDLLAATAATIDAVTVEDARAFYALCGFPLPRQFIQRPL